MMPYETALLYMERVENARPTIFSHGILKECDKIVICIVYHWEEVIGLVMTDREAEITRMMETYGGMLAGLCTAMLGDPDLAQDVTQETFMRAYRSLNRFDGKHEKTWLTRIAVNLCRDQWRSRWFRHMDRRVTPDMLPETAAPAGEENGRVLEAVQTLPGKLREVVLLRYFQDMEPEEIARALGINRATVYRRLDKAHGALRTILEGEDPDA